MSMTYHGEQFLSEIDQNYYRLFFVPMGNAFNDIMVIINELCVCIWLFLAKCFDN